MKQLFNICISSHDEVLFRDESDYNTFTNLMALYAFHNKVELIADAIMSTHVHLAVMASDPTQFIASLRHSYGSYFNRKYKRNGRLGPKGFYCKEVNGQKHRNMLISYILRNGLHHAQSATAFGYPHCTIGSVFTKELGRKEEQHLITSKEEMAKVLPRYAVIPDHFIMNEQHVFLRESFMEIKLLESFFVTPRNFLFQMNRITDEIWLNEQLEDSNNEKPITLNTVEFGYDSKTVSRMLECEKGFKFDANSLKDTDVCRIIDTQMVKKYHAASVYCLSATQKQKISQQLQKDLKIPAVQANRCVAISYTVAPTIRHKADSVQVRQPKTPQMPNTQTQLQPNTSERGNAASVSAAPAKK